MGPISLPKPLLVKAMQLHDEFRPIRRCYGYQITSRTWPAKKKINMVDDLTTNSVCPHLEQSKGVAPEKKDVGVLGRMASSSWCSEAWKAQEAGG